MVFIRSIRASAELQTSIIHQLNEDDQKEDFLADTITSSEGMIKYDEFIDVIKEEEEESGHHQQQQRRKSFIIDTDIGNFCDDFWAIAYLISCPDVDIKYIIISGGDTHSKAKILAKFLMRCGVNDIPFGIGPPTNESPYLLPNEHGHLLPCHEYTAKAVHNPIMKEWAWSFNLQKYKGQIDDESTSITHFHNLLKQMETANEDVTLLMLGTTENMSHLLDRDEDALRNVHRLVSMGGTLNGTEEYNYMLAPVDTRRVLRSCDRDVIVVPADVCMKSSLDLGVAGDRNTYAHFLNGDTKLALAITSIELALANYGTHTEVANGRTDLLFDAVAAFVAKEEAPDLFEFKKCSYILTEMGRLEPTTTNENEENDNKNGEENVLQLEVVAGWANEDTSPIQFHRRLVESIVRESDA